MALLRRLWDAIRAMTRTVTVATIAGDGIGPEVLDAARPAIERAARLDDTTIAWNDLPLGADHYLATGESLPDSTFRYLRDDVDAILVGAFGDPRVPDNEHARDILLGLRFRLDLYVNFRPVELLHPDLCALRREGGKAGGRDVDFVIFRENTEGAYLGEGTAEAVGTEEERQVSHEIHTVPKIRRIVQAAFAWAAKHGKTLVTMTDKSNAIPAHRLWRRVFDEIGTEYPGITREHRYVDVMAMEMVQAPERLQVVVTQNLYGDILSDLGAGLVGGLGLAASANLHPDRAGLFEPVHGSAPPLAGKGVANPMASILTGALMLDDLGCPTGAQALQVAVRQALADGIRTRDLGGELSTTAAAQAVLDRI
ncbi:MAG: isocitrate/isopropylmalate family dehydrogenase [Gemmatimonadales bacterium]